MYPDLEVCENLEQFLLDNLVTFHSQSKVLKSRKEIRARSALNNFLAENTEAIKMIFERHQEPARGFTIFSAEITFKKILADVSHCYASSKIDLDDSMQFPEFLEMLVRVALDLQGHGED